MTDREAFLAAIIARPADDLPRLVFADWLEEHGEPERAEFIRVQCELAKTEANGENYGKHWIDLVNRLREFSDQGGNSALLGWCRATLKGQWEQHAGDYIYNAAYWAGYGAWINATFVRGFIATLRGPLAALLSHGPAICREHLVESVEVTDAQTRLVSGRAPDIWFTFVEDDPDRSRGWPAVSMEESVLKYNAAILATIKKPTYKNVGTIAEPIWELL